MSELKTLRVVLAKPRGFCAGVERAVQIVERALDIHGPPVYVRHEIVHNKRVVEDLRRRGAIFVSEVDEIPLGSPTVFSAHGVPRQVELQALARGLDVIDATCPLVHKVHSEGRRYSAQGYDVILIGHTGHQEVEGTRGQIPGRVSVLSTPQEVEALHVRDPGKVAYVTQTTLSVSDTREVIAALKRRFPDVVGPDTRDICYATQNRQSAVLELSKCVDVILVVGANNSSNSNRLREIGVAAGTPTYLIETAQEIEPSRLCDFGTIGITAAASAPDVVVQEVIERLRDFAPIDVVELDGIEEEIHFKLPQRLSRDSKFISTQYR